MSYYKQWQSFHRDLQGQTYTVLTGNERAQNAKFPNKSVKKD